jgi:serine/threonine protein kinase
MVIKTDMDAVIHYFLNLFRIQSGVRDLENVRCEVKRLSDPETDRECICELRVHRGGKWKSRRITVSPLGQNVESRSACFKVIYDDLLVLKIPAQPIRDFDDYLEHILIESNVSSRLFPEIMCVRPTVSTILRKIPGLGFDRQYPSDVIEEKYIEMLQRRPGLQTFLKIGSTFIFFMNLSRYTFFGQVLDSMHDSRKNLQSAILQNGESLWDFEAFTNLYGPGSDRIFFQMSRVLSDFDHQVDRLQDRCEEILSLQPFQKKKWFLARLAEKPDDEKTDRISETCSRQLNLVFKSLETDHYESLSAFRSMIYNHVGELNFDKNRTIIRGIIINILRLLHYLIQKRVAIRDLKPDNIFIKADLDRGGPVLTQSDGYTLGLIDLETAASCGDTEMEPPILAGTAGYCTPSHFFPIEMLQRLFPDPFQIFYLQDWFAALAMIYHTVTGKPLFHETGKLVMEIYRIREKKSLSISDPEQTFKHVSWVFWNTAVCEFQDRLHGDQERLRRMTIPLPACVQEMFRLEIRRQTRQSSENLKKVMFDNPIKPVYQNKSEQEIIQGTIGSKNRNPFAGSWLDSVSSLKDRMAELSRVSRADLNSLTAYELLRIMFLLIYLPMYPESWKDRQQPRFQNAIL